MDIREILNHLRSAASDRQIHRDTGIARRTVKRYREWAQAQNLLEGPLPPLEELQALLESTQPGSSPPQNVSTVEPYRELVTKLVKENVETAAIRQRLKERGYTGTYSAVYRFVRTIQPKQPKTTVRVERKPGEEGQVDGVAEQRTAMPGTCSMRRVGSYGGPGRL